MNLNNEICNAFNAHARGYEAAAKVQHEIGERLFERLDYIKIKPRFILDLGSGSGLFSKRLKQVYPEAVVIGFDLAFAMLQQSRLKQGFFKKWSLVNGNMASMPFPSGLFDLVFANQVIHWSTDLSDVIQELNRVMNKDGCLLFSTLGPDTFSELKKAWRDVNLHAHTNEFADMHDLGDILLEKRFVDPVVDMEMLTVHYPTLDKLVRNIKAQGVRNINRNRNPGLTGKNAFKKFEQSFDAFKTPQGKFPLTYEVVYGHAWKGEQRLTDKGVETLIPLSSLRVGRSINNK